VDAVELLEHDHRMVEQLFRDYQAARSDDQRRGIVEILIRELSKHAALEELIVYPLGKRVLDNGEREVQHHLSEHMAVKRLLAKLDKLSTGAPETADLLAELEMNVHEHVQDEETVFLPQLRSVVDQQALDELGQELDKGKQTAPTRPHPHAPDQPPALAMAAPVAAIYDRLRDRLQGRPQT
jgi:hemerythrin superfamily protein